MKRQNTSPSAERLLSKLPRQDILAIAGSLHAIAKAQVAAGKKLTAEEAAILERAERQLKSSNH